MRFFSILSLGLLLSVCALNATHDKPSQFPDCHGIIATKDQAGQYPDCAGVCGCDNGVCGGNFAGVCGG